MLILSVGADSDQTNELPDAALRYALAYNWRVLPLHSIVDGRCTCDAGESCGTPGKHPLNARGCSDATRHEETIRKWWAEAPTANVGIATGEHSDLFMVGPDGAAGVEALAKLEQENGTLPPTPKARSGSGTGYHHLFR